MKDMTKINFKVLDLLKLELGRANGQRFHFKSLDSTQISFSCLSITRPKTGGRAAATSSANSHPNGTLALLYITTSQPRFLIALAIYKFTEVHNGRLCTCQKSSLSRCQYHAVRFQRYAKTINGIITSTRQEISKR